MIAARGFKRLPETTLFTLLMSAHPRPEFPAIHRFKAVRAALPTIGGGHFVVWQSNLSRSIVLFESNIIPRTARGCAEFDERAGCQGESDLPWRGPGSMIP